jgi:hypothetical protein
MVQKKLNLPARVLAPLLPYIVIGTGLLVLHNAWMAILSYHLCMVVILFFAGGKTYFKQINRPGNYYILIFTAALGLAGGLLLYLIWPLLAVPGDIDLYLENIGLTEAAWPYFIAYFIVINPWIEEYYWRGYLGSNSKRIILNDLLFAGYHILVLMGKMNIIWLIAIFVVLSLTAWLWRQSNRMNKGLITSIVSHITADISVILAIYFGTTGI